MSRRVVVSQKRVLSPVFDLKKATEAAKILRAQFSDLIGDDEEFAADLVEGETTLYEEITRAVETIALATAAVDGTSEFIKRLEARRDKRKQLIEDLKIALHEALKYAGVESFPHDLATLSLRAVPPSVQIDDESVIPSEFWITGEPKLDKKALLAALKDNQVVPGARKSDARQAIAIRWR